jgi:hypothetical protein
MKPQRHRGAEKLKENRPSLRYLSFLFSVSLCLCGQFGMAI